MIAALDGGASKALVCRTFGIRRSTLIDSLARIGWSAQEHLGCVLSAGTPLPS